MPPAALWVELWKWKEPWLGQHPALAAFRGWLQSCVASAAASCSSDLPWGCIGLADTAELRQELAEPCPSWEFFQTSAGSCARGRGEKLRQLLVGSECPQLSCCGCWGVAWIEPTNQQLSLSCWWLWSWSGARAHLTIPSASQVWEGAVQGLWMAVAGGSCPAKAQVRTRLPQPGHLPIHERGAGEGRIAQH